MQQYQREILIGAFLDITAAQWKDWLTRTGDDAIPDELHEHLVNIMLGLEHAQGHTYQQYLQALTLLCDGNLHWLVQQVSGKDPLTTIT